MVTLPLNLMSDAELQLRRSARLRVCGAWIGSWMLRQSGGWAHCLARRCGRGERWTASTAEVDALLGERPTSGMGCFMGAAGQWCHEPRAVSE